MSKADMGHSALDVQADIAGGKENRIRFLQAAIHHTEEQVEILDSQMGAIARKADEVYEQWQAKIDEAEAMKEHAESELDVLIAELNSLTGN